MRTYDCRAVHAPHRQAYILNRVARTITPACILPCYCTVAIPQKSVRTTRHKMPPPHRLALHTRQGRTRQETRHGENCSTLTRMRPSEMGLYNKTGCREHTSPLPAIQHRWKGDKGAACGPVRESKALANTWQPHEGTFRAATSQAAVVGVPRALAHQQGPQQETTHLWALTDGHHARTPKRLQPHGMRSTARCEWGAGRSTRQAMYRAMGQVTCDNTSFLAAHKAQHAHY